MLELDTLIFFAVCVVLLGVGFAIRWHRNRLVATNALERSLISSLGTGCVTPEMQQLLFSVRLLALEPFEAGASPVEPMSLTATFPQEFANQVSGCHIAENGTLQFGPYVICWSSAAWANKRTRNVMLGGIVARLGKLREFSAREVFRSARAHRFDVVLNPFVGVTRRFTQDEILAILKAEERPA